MTTTRVLWNKAVSSANYFISCSSWPTKIFSQRIIPIYLHLRLIFIALVNIYMCNNITLTKIIYKIWDHNDITTLKNNELTLSTVCEKTTVLSVISKTSLHWVFTSVHGISAEPRCPWWLPSLTRGCGVWGNSAARLNELTAAIQLQNTVADSYTKEYSEQQLVWLPPVALELPYNNG